MIIDHIDRLELEDDRADQYGNELNTLRYLKTGLGYLCHNVQAIESEFRRQTDGFEVWMGGNVPPGRAVPSLAESAQDLIACAFHWYSVSACNYVRLVGWLAFNEDTSKAKTYVTEVIPDVEVFRNKVAAHFARVDPRPRHDTLAHEFISVMFPVSFQGDSFVSPPFTLTVDAESPKISGNTSDLQPWSLTQVHQRLSKRYWPT